MYKNSRLYSLNYFKESLIIFQSSFFLFDLILESKKIRNYKIILTLLVSNIHKYITVIYEAIFCN